MATPDDGRSQLEGVDGHGGQVDASLSEELPDAGQGAGGLGHAARHALALPVPPCVDALAGGEQGGAGHPVGLFARAPKGLVLALADDHGTGLVCNLHSHSRSEHDRPRDLARGVDGRARMDAGAEEEWQDEDRERSHLCPAIAV